MLRRELCCAGNYIETLVLYNTVKYERLVLLFCSNAGRAYSRCFLLLDICLLRVMLVGGWLSFMFWSIICLWNTMSLKIHVYYALCWHEENDLKV